MTWRNGSYSVGLIVLVIAIAVIINMIAGQLPENIRNIDISDNRIYEISDTSREILKDLDQEVTFTVYAEKSSTDDMIKTFLDKYTALSDKITVEWVDPVLHPSELTENDVSEDTILISCEDTEKSTTVAFSDILVTDEYSYYTTGSSAATEFDGEGQFTSAVNYVTSDSQKKIYYTTGHGEATFSSSVTDLLEKNNMTQEELNLLMTGEIPEDCDLLIIDDLGTELNNTFTSSQLFYCINERLIRRKGTIISTNLSLNMLQDLYTDRVASRIMSSYKLIPLYGGDIRIKKRRIGLD